MNNTVTVKELEERAKKGEHVAIVYQCPLNPDYLIVFYDHLTGNWAYYDEENTCRLVSRLAFVFDREGNEHWSEVNTNRKVVMEKEPNSDQDTYLTQEAIDKINKIDKEPGQDLAKHIDTLQDKIELEDQLKEAREELAALKPKRVLWERQELKEGIYLNDVVDGVITGHNSEGNIIVCINKTQSCEEIDAWTILIGARRLWTPLIEDCIDYAPEAVVHWRHNGQPLHLEPKPKEEQGIYYGDLPDNSILRGLDHGGDIQAILYEGMEFSCTFSEEARIRASIMPNMFSEVWYLPAL